MGLREELLAIDPEIYGQIRRQVEHEYERGGHSAARDALARISIYPGLVLGVQRATELADADSGGTFFGSTDRFVAEKESLIGAVSLARYAELQSEV